jgi:hypothetical protein
MQSKGSQDPSLVGRPIFFVRPHSVVQNELLGELIRNEFAVAVVADHTKVLDIVRLYPHCIAFLNIDEGFTEPEWESLIRSIQDDPASADVRLGVVTYHPNTELSHKYLLELGLPCGYIKMSLGLTESSQTILKVLESNEARGRRQYLRVPCREGWASLNVVNDGKVLNGSLVDISSVGLSCTFDNDPEFVARSLVKNIQLKLRGLLCTVSAVVMGTRTRDDGSTLYVLLFDPRTVEDTKEKIRVYQRKTLQMLFQEELDKSADEPPI